MRFEHVNDSWATLMINLSSVVSSDLPLSGSDISENSIPKEPFSTSLECDPETYEKLVGEVEQRRMTFPNFKELDEHIRMLFNCVTVLFMLNGYHIISYLSINRLFLL